MDELTYFDILAKLVGIAKGFPNEIYEKFETIDYSKIESPLHKILIKNNITVPKNCISSYKLWKFSKDSTDIRRIDKYIDTILNKEKKPKTEIDYFTILFLILGLNYFLMQYLYIQKTHDSMKKEGLLNNNSKECGIALYKNINALWEHQNGGKEAGLTCFNLASNFYIRDLSIQEKYQYNYEDMWYSSEFELLVDQLRENKVLKIGMTGVSDLRPFRIILGKGEYENNFEVQLLPTYEEYIIPKIIKIIQKACEESVDILIFPEMLGSIKINDKIKNTLNELSFSGQRTPLLVIAPSVWENNKNELSVFSNIGQKLLTQQKIASYIHLEDGVKYKEALNKTSEINVLHIEGLGRLTFPICKSFISPIFKSITEVVKPLLILCPSYSTSHHSFETKANAFASTDCNVVWCNCCRALKHPNDSSKNVDNKVSDKAKKDDAILGFTTQFGNIYEPVMDTFKLEENCKKYNKNGCEEICLRIHKISFKNIIKESQLALISG